MKEIGISDVLCNNLGALYIAKNLGFTLHSGFGMNFVNTLDLLWAEEYGIKDAELSFELDFMDKAETEYRKWEVRTLSPVEQAYLNSIKTLNHKTKKKG